MFILEKIIGLILRKETTMFNASFGITCLNGGSIELFGNYSRCNCKEEYSGNSCEIRDKRYYSLILTILMVICFIVCISTLCCHLKFK